MGLYIDGLKDCKALPSRTSNVVAISYLWLVYVVQGCEDPCRSDKLCGEVQVGLLALNGGLGEWLDRNGITEIPYRSVVLDLILSLLTGNYSRNLIGLFVTR